MPHRAVKDLDLAEVSILDRTKSPAYEGTLISARTESDAFHFRGEDFIDEVEVREEATQEETQEVTTEVVEEKVQEEVPAEAEPKQQEIVEKIDYSKYEEIIAEMKEEK